MEAARHTQEHTQGQAQGQTQAQASGVEQPLVECWDTSSDQATAEDHLGGVTMDGAAAEEQAGAAAVEEGGVEMELGGVAVVGVAVVEDGSMVGLPPRHTLEGAVGQALEPGLLQVSLLFLGRLHF